MMLCADVSIYRQKGRKTEVGVKPRRFLFEIRRDLFPEGCLTEVEMGLWSRFHGYMLEQHR